MAPREIPSDPRSILLVRLSSVGDAVCAMPLALALRRRFPRARLLWAVEPDAAPLLEGHASSAEPVLVPRTGGPLQRARSVRALRALRPDLVVDAQGNAKSGVVARLAARGAPAVGLAAADVRERANLAFTTHRAPPSGEPHGTRRALGLLRALGAEPPAGPPEYGLRTTAAERAAAAALLPPGARSRPVCLLHPGRPGDLRSWTPGGNEALARALLRRGWTVVLEGPDLPRPAEARAARRRLAASGALDLGSRLPLRLLAALVDLLAREHRAGPAPRALVSPDTLLPHLAAAFGLPVVLVAGPQDPARTGPLGAGPSEAVRAWEGLPCAPCRKRTCAHEEERACLARVRPAAVEAAVLRVTAGAGP